MKTRIFEPAFLPHDDNTIQQLNTCAEAGDAPYAVLCADAHLGYSAPIGSAVAYEDYLSPSGVGFDIACGNKAVELDLYYDEVVMNGDLAKTMDEIQRRISFGVGRVNNEPVEHLVIDAINQDAPLPEIKALAPMAEKQLGTVGSGNHYVNLFRDVNTNRVWIGVHFGSRGFGHKIASGFLALAQGLKFGDRYSEGSMMAEPTLFHEYTNLGEYYRESMELAGEYAYAGRDVVVNKVVEILGNPEVLASVHNHHNYLWREKHYGLEYWVVRKGSTPLFPDQKAFVGSTMAENSVILEGIDSHDAQEALYSAPHGAGRAMSRTQAAGKWKKRWINNVRDDNAVYMTQEEALAAPGATKAGKVRVRVDPMIDYGKVQQEVRKKGIELRGGAADEAPMAYKRLPDVLAAHSETLRVVNTLSPIGVCMAGEGVVDPYRD